MHRYYFHHPCKRIFLIEFKINLLILIGLRFNNNMSALNLNVTYVNHNMSRLKYFVA